jgi:trimeric autotransporter adhesin
MKKISLLLSFVLSSAFAFGQTGSVLIQPSNDEVMATKYSGSEPNLAGRYALGTSSAPLAVSSGNALVSFGARGYTGSAFTSDRARITMSADQTFTSGANGTRISFFTTTNGTTAISERMRIDNTGFVGIGTTSPERRLHVFNGSSGVTPNSFAGLFIENSASAYLQLGAPEASAVGVLFGKPSNALSGSVLYDSGNNMLLRTGGNNTRMTITSAGNVGIGTSSPDRALEVSSSGTSYVRVSDASSGGSDVGFELFRTGIGARDWRVANSAGDIDFRVSSDDFATTVLEYQMTTTGFLPGIDNVNDLGSASFRWDDVYATNGTIQTSDRREKENIKTLNYGLKDVMKLSPVRYTWKSSPEKGQKVGLIAQEVATIIPEVVNGLKADGSVGEQRLGMNYAELVPVLINAIKEQQQIIDQLNQNVSALSSEVASIKKQFDVNSDKVKAVTATTGK